MPSDLRPSALDLGPSTGACRATVRLAAAFAAALPASAGASITVDEVVHQGQSSYRVVTPTATWIYHREGAGFASLLDADGNDWIAYRPEGGATGHYRGIPNAVFRRLQEGNNFFHPGHSGPKASETALIVSEPDRVVLRSRSTDGRWSGEWEIRADHARFRLTRLPPEDRGYWFLYEGTPGGRFDPTDLCLRADGALSPLSETWQGDVRDLPWVAFISPPSGHALLLIAHDPPEAPLSYRPMQDAMTVFGFGRKQGSLENLLTHPVTFTVALVAETDPDRISAFAASQRSQVEPAFGGQKSKAGRE